VAPGAAVEALVTGAVRIETASAPWQHAVGFPVDFELEETELFAVVTCRRGEVGVALLAPDGATQIAPEALIAAGDTRLIRSPVSGNGEPARWLMVRTGALPTVSQCDLLAAYAGRVPVVALTDEEIGLALRDPAAARTSCARRAWAGDVLATLGTTDAPLRIDPPEAPLRLPAPGALWSGEVERIVLDSAQDLVALLEAFQPQALERHVALLPRDSMSAYLRMNIVRVVRVVETLRRRGLVAGRVLEVGSWFGSFALALRRLGYDVTACDRYTSYGSAFDRYVELLQGEGVHIVSTRREGELEQIAGLGEFDVVLAGAVIEHVPHTPRKLLETLFGAVRPGGALLLDTPNVARYWNRVAITRGETIFQPLEEQYLSDPPWEGHHREFTANELTWMLQHVGCEDVGVEFLDYNMLQFEELSAEHIACLAAIVDDPTQSDTLLASGRRPAG
jgi:SAM-dependent methyltransferase